MTKQNFKRSQICYKFNFKICVLIFADFSLNSPSKKTPKKNNKKDAIKEEESTQGESSSQGTSKFCFISIYFSN